MLQKYPLSLLQPMVNIYIKEQRANFITGYDNDRLSVHSNEDDTWFITWFVSTDVLIKYMCMWLKGHTAKKKKTRGYQFA